MLLLICLGKAVALMLVNGIQFLSVKGPKKIDEYKEKRWIEKDLLSVNASEGQITNKLKADKKDINSRRNKNWQHMQKENKKFEEN